MRTVTIDIINEKALTLLRDLESLKLIRLREDDSATAVDWTRYKGAMSKQPLNGVDQQLDELRGEWQ